MFDLDRTKEIIEKVVCAEGIELVEVESKGSPGQRILRIFIDKPAGITHDDCVRVSGQVGAVLDVENLVSGSYTLEVSSPGLTRKLTKEADYRRYVGRLAKLQTRQVIGNTKNFRGTIEGVKENEVILKTSDSELVRIPLDWITKANLDFDF